jgi:hypothetical protein
LLSFICALFFAFLILAVLGMSGRGAFWKVIEEDFHTPNLDWYKYMHTWIQVGFLGRPNNQIARPNLTRRSCVLSQVRFGSLDFPIKSNQNQPKTWWVMSCPGPNLEDQHRWS